LNKGGQQTFVEWKNVSSYLRVTSKQIKVMLKELIIMNKENEERVCGKGADCTQYDRHKM
jgi:hypothetical protein